MNGDPSVTVTIQDVLKHTGLTTGAIYYHFADFQDLLDHAYIEVYTGFTAAGIQGLAEAVAESSTVDELRRSLKPVIASRHHSDQWKTRAALAWITAQATFRPSLGEKLAPAQRQLTQGIVETVTVAQQKGLVQSGLDPQVIAVFLQAYALGRIVDDLAGGEMDSARWASFIAHMVNAAILD